MTRQEKLLKQLDKIVYEFNRFYSYAKPCSDTLQVADYFIAECLKMKDIIYDKNVKDKKE